MERLDSGPWVMPVFGFAGMCLSDFSCLVFVAFSFASPGLEDFLWSPLTCGFVILFTAFAAFATPDAVALIASVLPSAPLTSDGPGSCL